MSNSILDKINREQKEREEMEQAEPPREES